MSTYFIQWGKRFFEKLIAALFFGNIRKIKYLKTGCCGSWLSAGKCEPLVRFDGPRTKRKIGCLGEMSEYKNQKPAEFIYLQNHNS